MKYKDIIKKLQPYAEQEVNMVAYDATNLSLLSFYTEKGEPICDIGQRYDPVTYKSEPAKFIKGV